MKFRWALISMVLATQLYGHAAPASEGPPGQEGQLKYFGYYASDPFIAETADHANVTWTWTGPEESADSMASRAVPTLQQAEANGVGVMLSVQALFFNPDGTLKPDEDLWLNWWIFSQAIKPYEKNITGFYPMDEPGNYCAGQPYNKHKGNNCWDHLQAALGVAAYIMKGTFPDKPIAVIHGYFEIMWARDGKQPILNPNYFDWHSFDCYSADFYHCGTKDYGEDSIPNYLTILGRALRKGQKMFLVPNAWSPSSDQGPAFSEDMLIEQAHQYEDLALHYHDDAFFMAGREIPVIGLFPFLWRHSVMKGVSEMPRLTEVWKEIGRRISNPEVEKVERLENIPADLPQAVQDLCADKHCIAVTGTNFMPDSSIDVRVPGDNKILQSHGGVEIVHPPGNSNMVIFHLSTVKMDNSTMSEYDMFSNHGLNVWVVNPSRGNSFSHESQKTFVSY